MYADHKPKTTDTHPLTGRAMTGAEIIVQVLVDEGVGQIFGYSGGAILPSYDAVFRYNQEHSSESPPGTEPLPLIVPANEQGAAFMAAGYARSTGKVGVAMVTSGPGATNTVTAVRDCFADSIPIVVICGQVPTAAIGTDAFQEAPVSSIMGSCAKHLFLVTDPERLESTMRSAFEIARTIGYPVLVRPSYVLGGRAMEIVYDDEALDRYMTHAVQASPDKPILVDKFLQDAIEVDVDCISDGTHVVLGAIMEHIEEAGIHSGDSACVLPPYTLSDALQEEITVCRVLPQVGLSQTFPFDPLLHIVPCNIIPTHQSSDQQLDAISTCVKQCGKATKVYTRV